MLSEVTHLQDVVDNLCTLSQDPSCLPDTAEQAVADALHEVIQPSSTLEQKVRTLAVAADQLDFRLFVFLTNIYLFCIALDKFALYNVILWVVCR